MAMTHFLIQSQIRNWNKVVRGFVIALGIALLFSLLIAQFGARISWIFYKHMFEILRIPLFWLAILMSAAIMVLPLIFERYYWQLYRFPRFF